MPFLEQIPQSILCCLHVIPYIILKWVQRLFKVLWNNSSNIYEVFAETIIYIFFVIIDDTNAYGCHDQKSIFKSVNMYLDI